MSKLIFSSIRIKSDVEELFERYSNTEISEKLLVHNLSVLANIYTSKVSEDTGWGPDVSLLLDIAEKYALLSSLKIGKDQFFKNVAKCFFSYSYDSVEECYLLDKMVASAKKIFDNEDWEPEYLTYALLTTFINDIGSFSSQDFDEDYEDTETILYNISYFDKYQKTHIYYENLELYKIDADRYIFDIGHAYLVVQSNRAVVLNKPIVDSFKPLIDLNVFFTKIILPLGFEEAVLTRVIAVS